MNTGQRALWGARFSSLACQTAGQRLGRHLLLAEGKSAALWYTGGVLQIEAT